MSILRITHTSPVEYEPAPPSIMWRSITHRCHSPAPWLLPQLTISSPYSHIIIGRRFSYGDIIMIKWCHSPSEITPAVDDIALGFTFFCSFKNCERDTLGTQRGGGRYVKALSFFWPPQVFWCSRPLWANCTPNMWFKVDFLVEDPFRLGFNNY